MGFHYMSKFNAFSCGWPLSCSCAKQSQASPKQAHRDCLACQEVEEYAMRSTIEWGKLHPHGLQLPTRWSPESLKDAYKRCGTITADYAKTFYLVSLPQHIS